MKTSKPFINRRQFLGRGAQGAGALAMGSAAWAAAAEKSVNPFAYDVDHLAKTDPKLIRYEVAGRFVCPYPDPKRIALGPDSRVYVAARTGVSVHDQDGTPLASIPATAPVRCVAVAADGMVYVGLRDHIEVFDTKGQRVAGWESPGRRTWFTGLAVSDKEVFAADSGNRVVLRYDRSGKLAGKIGEKNKERNVPGLIVPSPYLDVALAPDGLLRVNNPGRHCVETYTTAGDLELSWGKPTGAIEGFCGCCNPIGIALLPDGRCVTSEKGLPRVKVYSGQGQFESVVAGTESFPENARAGSARDSAEGSLGGLDAATDATGRIYVLDVVVGDVHIMKRKA
jgi:hypothetical protein